MPSGMAILLSIRLVILQHILASFAGDFFSKLFICSSFQLDEIRQCKDCYYHSNARMKDWFCQPCVSTDPAYLYL